MEGVKTDKRLGVSRSSKLKFTLGASGLLLLVLFLGFYIKSSSEQEVLPDFVSAKDFESPDRNPGTFSENYSDSASKSELVYSDDSKVEFKYKKSTKFDHAFAGVFFPIEKLNLDFSDFDEIEVFLTTELARRIPVNFAFGTKLETHQYIRNFIDAKEGENSYVLRFEEFFTPEWWYDYNKVSQAEIPKQDFAQVEAVSFESCHLLDKGIEDSFTIHSIMLRKDTGLAYSLLALVAILGIAGMYVYFFEVFASEKEIIHVTKKELVHVPVESVEVEEERNVDDEILVFLGKNYTNPNLTLSDLSEEFGKTTSDISKLVKEKTDKTFPKYLSFLRINEAKRILAANEHKTIAEVGYTVGFNSSSNFIRVFKSQEGVSPKNYSDQLKGE